MTYTRTNTLVFFLIVLALVSVALLIHQLYRSQREKRFRQDHSLFLPLDHRSQVMCAEAFYHALHGESIQFVADDEEQAERVFQRARQWFEDNYDLQRGE